MKTFRILSIFATSLLLAILACSSDSTTVDESLPTVSFSTVTPGGHISVSLLTAAQTSQGVQQDTTLIGPVATQTAAAATQFAQTAVAAIPTPTIPGILTTPQTCPEEATPSLPNQGPAFTRYAELIVQYLSSGGAPTILEASLRSWGAISEIGGLVRSDRDFNGDGVPEVLVVVLDPDRLSDRVRPGDLYIFGCDSGIYRLYYQAGYAADLSFPLIHSADDITGDYVNDLVYSVESCGVNFCDREIRAIGWNFTLGNFDSLIEQAIIEPEANVIVSDVDEDRLKEISVTRGVIPSAEAGPQRTVTTIWKWNGTSFTVAEVIHSPVEYRIHLIHDGDAALAAKKYDDAIDLYRAAIDDDVLRSWQYLDEVIYLKAFARYRIMLTQAAKGDPARAQQAYDDLAAEYLSPTAPPGEGTPQPTATPFGARRAGVEFFQMADLFWQDYTLNRDLIRACAIVIGYAQANPTGFEVLNSFGFANPTYTAEDLCPFVR